MGAILLPMIYAFHYPKSMSSYGRGHGSMNTSQRTSWAVYRDERTEDLQITFRQGALKTENHFPITQWNSQHFGLEFQWKLHRVAFKFWTIRFHWFSHYQFQICLKWRSNILRASQTMRSLIVIGELKTRSRTNTMSRGPHPKPSWVGTVIDDVHGKIRKPLVDWFIGAYVPQQVLLESCLGHHLKHLIPSMNTMALHTQESKKMFSILKLVSILSV